MIPISTRLFLFGLTLYVLVIIYNYNDGKVTGHWTMIQPADVIKMMASTTALLTTSLPVLPTDSAKTKK